MLSKLSEFLHLKKTHNSNFFYLPKELQLLILQLLDLQSLAQLAQTCKFFNTLSQNDSLWKQKLTSEKIPLPTSPTPLKLYYKNRSMFSVKKVTSLLADSQVPLLKIMLIGTSEAKKSQIIAKLDDESEFNVAIDVVGVEFKVKFIKIDGKPVKLQVWDTAGQERFRSITSPMLKGANGVFLMFNFGSSESFTALKNLFENAKKALPENCKIMLLGIQDGESQQVVDHEDVKKFAEALHIEYLTANLDYQNEILQAFGSLTRQILPAEAKSGKDEVQHDDAPRKNDCSVM